MNRILHQANALALEFTFEFQPEFSHNPPRGRIPWHRNRNDAVQLHPFEGVAQRHRGGFRRQGLPPAAAGHPPSQLPIHALPPHSPPPTTPRPPPPPRPRSAPPPPPSPPPKKRIVSPPVFSTNFQRQ